MTIEVRNLRHVGNDFQIDCEIKHPEAGWIGFVACKSELEWNETTQAVFKALGATPILSLPASPIIAMRALDDARIWRDGELERADIELLKAEDGDGTGTPSEWRAYRRALRAWPESPEFPSQGSRPAAPDLAKEG